MAKAKKTKLKLMLSSTVYGMEDRIEQIYAMLQSYGYQVWNSHMGSLPVKPDLSAFEACLAAVDACDIFFGIIRPHYGSGKAAADDKSITHQELSRAIELGKPNFFLADRVVVNARRLLLDLGHKGPKGRVGLELRKGADLIDDLRVIDMYEEATQDTVPIKERTGNWVQSYGDRDDILRYVEEQFDRYEDLEKLVNRPSPAAEGEAET
ncbi:DUF4062 domain-containing protein [Pacificimonas sp. ICDLI1SI03]